MLVPSSTTYMNADNSIFSVCFCFCFVFVSLFLYVSLTRPSEQLFILPFLLRTSLNSLSLFGTHIFTHLFVSFYIFLFVLLLLVFVSRESRFSLSLFHLIAMLHSFFPLLLFNIQAIQLELCLWVRIKRRRKKNTQREKKVVKRQRQQRTEKKYKLLKIMGTMMYVQMRKQTKRQAWNRT